MSPPDELAVERTAERPARAATRYRWLATPDDILGAPELRGDPAALTFARLMLGAGGTLEGALTVVFNGVAMQFGMPDTASANSQARRTLPCK